MTRERHLTWENFRKHFIASGTRAIHPIPGTPGISFFTDPFPQRIGMRIESTDPAWTKNYREIAIGEVRDPSGQRYIEVYVADEQLFRPFYSVMTEVADLIQVHGLRPRDAIVASVASLLRLLKHDKPMTKEEELGLWGELWILQHLLREQGSAAISSWVGPSGGPHDFRLGDLEIEVKTTASSKRIHVVHGLNQMLASPGCQLFVVSLQVADAGHGAGCNLQQLAGRVSSLFDYSSSERESFDNRLRSVGYRPSDTLETAYRLRSRPIAIPVDDSCPRLTSSLLATVVRAEVLQRIVHVDYRLDLEGIAEGRVPRAISALLESEEGDGS